MKTYILNITESEIDDLCEHGQIVLFDEIQDTCDSCSEPFEIEIMLKIDND